MDFTAGALLSFLFLLYFACFHNASSVVVFIFMMSVVKSHFVVGAVEQEECGEIRIQGHMSR